MSRNLTLIYKEVFFFALMVGAGESYLGAYALFLGASPLLVGMVGAAPFVFASVGQFLAFYLNQFCKIRSILLSTISLEILSFLCLTIPLFIPDYAIPTFITSTAFYFIIRNVTSPTQNLFFKSAIPAEIRGTFSGKRQKGSFLVILLSLLVFGGILELAKNYHHEFYAYLTFCLVAAVARLKSLFLFRQMDIADLNNERPSSFTFLDFIREITHNNFGRFVLLTTMMGFASNFIGGYLAVYFLKELHLSYLIFALLISLSWLTQYLSVTFWGQLTDKIGSRAIVIVTAYGLTAIPLLWLAGTNLAWMCFVQIFSGLVWSGYNLATSDYTFDAVQGKNYVKCQAYQATINSIGVILAVLISGIFQNYAYAGDIIQNPFITVFAVSFALRVLTVLILTKRINEVKKFPENHNLNINFNFAGINIVARANLNFFRKD